MTDGQSWLDIEPRISGVKRNLYLYPNFYDNPKEK